MKTTLSIEESQKLIELGVDAKLASENVVTDEYNEQWENFRHPIFRLEDILSILPKEIDGYHLNISAGKIEWYVSYENIGINNTMLVKWDAAAPELIDALNSLLIWTIEQGHLKTEKK